MLQSQTPRMLVEAVTIRPGFTSAIGTRVVHAEVGCVHLALERKPDLLQFSGFFHGGVISALADHAGGGAVTTSLAPGKTVVTINLCVHFLAPADGQSLIARAKALQIGNTIGVANVEVFNVNGTTETVCATATVTLRIVTMPPSIGAHER